jgi:hypothetical protein
VFDQMKRPQRTTDNKTPEASNNDPAKKYDPFLGQGFCSCPLKKNGKLGLFFLGKGLKNVKLKKPEIDQTRLTFCHGNKTIKAMAKRGR